MIDEKNCPVPIYGDTAQARSDGVRLELLAKFGGVWADSTMLCMQPLDSWVWKDIEPAGVWMYHGLNTAALVKNVNEYNNCEGMALWFIIAKPGNEMIKKWLGLYRDFWNNHKSNDNYFLTDNLWYTLYEKDEQFKEIWKRVPNICCEDPGQSHYLAGRVHENVTQEIKDTIEKVKPRAMKLSNHHGVDENSKDSNAHYVINLSIK
jgi:hypothetical protein